MLGEMAPYVLLGFLIAGLMHAFVPQRTMARHLAGTGWRQVLKSVAIGVPLPLCSCGVLPTAVPGVTQVDVNLTTGIATVAGPHDPAALLAAVRSAGFDASPR